MSVAASKATSKDAPTEIFLPDLHFPGHGTEVEISSGQWTIGLDEATQVPVQKLKWWYGKGRQTLTVKGVVRRNGFTPSGDDEGYLNQYWQGGCSVT